MRIELPGGWTGRIVLGAQGLPVLHAASFQLPTNDSDSGQVAQESIGSGGQLYINVRDLGPGVRRAEASLPVQFHRSEFGPPPPGPGSRCCFITVASRTVETADRGYQVTVISGTADPPSEATVAETNRVAGSLALEPFQPEPVEAATGERVVRYGMSMKLASGWSGRISRGTLEAASFRLEPRDHPEDGQILLRLLEHGGSDAPFVTGRMPLRLLSSEFLRGEDGLAETGRSFVVSGRRFVLWATTGSLRPSSKALDGANQALAALRIEPGDFYPGTVEPARFPHRTGWHVGTSGSREVEPDGEFTTSWAATIPYVDEWNALPPDQTLGHLPTSGIVVVLGLSRTSRLPPLSEVQNPFQLADFERREIWQGQVRDLPEYVFWGTVDGQYRVDLRIYFGRPDPAPEVRAKAQAMLDGLVLPDWGPWELEP
jgi:hypothetical protein